LRFLPQQPGEPGPDAAPICTRVERWICLDGSTDDDSSLESIVAGSVEYTSDWIDAAGNRDRPVYYCATSRTTGEPKVVVDDVVSFEGALMFIWALPGMKADR
jgi:hypothetical protein